MCGIVGLTGQKPVENQLLEALKKLEYRGYDSAGIATIANGTLDRRRASGKLHHLETTLKEAPLAGNIGIAHTRWATHGSPTIANAHPHQNSRLSLVHNGIIENHQMLRDALEAKGIVFESQTDTEVILHQIDQHLSAGKPMRQALHDTLQELEGSYAIALLHKDEPQTLYVARHGSPLAIGIGNDFMAIGSDAIALSLFSSRLIYLEEGDYAVLTPTSHTIYNRIGNEVVRPESMNTVQAEAIGKGGYRHFMEKEIHEQPDAIVKTLASLKHPTLGHYALPELGLPAKEIKRVTLVACGTSFYSGCTGQYWLESLSKLPVTVEIASEFRYRNPPLEEGTLCIFISQSGETADTLAAMAMVKAQGLPTLAIINTPTSSMAREATAVLQTEAGVEIGVASTKAFTTQLVVLCSLALLLAKERGTLDASTVAQHFTDLETSAGLMREAIGCLTSEHDACHSLSHATDALYLGRGTSYPLALEGALKLKEISYIHAEGYAAGEMKHGPIALIDESVPIIVIAPDDHWQEKTLSNLQEAKARHGVIILIADAHTIASQSEYCDIAITLPDCPPLVSPLLYSIPIQLLAYYTALIKGTDIDQPRNLAKSVTVE